MTRVWLAFFTYCKGAPKGVFLERFDVPMFKKIQLPHGGPAVASPPSLSFNTNWMLRRKPCLRNWLSEFRNMWQIVKPQTVLEYRQNPPRSLCQKLSSGYCLTKVNWIIHRSNFIKLLRAPRFEVLFDSVRSIIHEFTKRFVNCTCYSS